MARTSCILSGMKLLTKSIGKALLLVSFAATAANLSGAVITSGNISLPSFLTSGAFALSGSNFTVNGSFDPPALSAWAIINSCHPCSSGFSLSVGGQSVGLSFHAGSGTVGATTASVLWGDIFAATGSSFAVQGPPITVTGPGSYTSSFTFTGFLCGTAGVGPEPRACVLDLPVLTGSGQVSVNVVQDFGSLLRTEAAVYTFNTVPEPSTVVVAAPVVLILLLSRKKLGRNRSL